MSAYISHHSYDCYQVQPVPVIASFDSMGHIAPLYVRLSGQPAHIASYWVRSHTLNTISFQCTLEASTHAQVPIVLTYYKDEEVWVVPDHSLNQ